MTEQVPTKERVAELNAILDSHDIYGDWEGLRVLSSYKIALVIEHFRNALAGISTCSSCDICRGVAIRALGEKE